MDGSVEVPSAPHVAIDPALHGQLLDCDAHLYMTPDIMAGIVRDIGGGFVLAHVANQMGGERYHQDRVKARSEPWVVKGLGALGAYDARERVELMDALGIRAQLVFPNTALRELRIDSDVAREACRRFNDFALQWTKDTDGRGRALCQINMADVDWAMAELERVIAGGCKGVTLPCASPPAGVSPAHSVWDPFWRRLEEADIPALLHIANGGLVTSDADDPVIPPRGFGDAEALKASFDMRPGAEEAIGPYFFLVAHIPVEVFLISMVMGGVFERFPRLRFGVIECGSSWVGPMVERMETHANMLAKLGMTYPLRPSEYVRRNVRVTPFWHEEIDTLIERHGMPEIYVFSTDFPHVEGTRDPIGRFKKTMTRQGSAYDAAFFVDNAKLLFPGL